MFRPKQTQSFDRYSSLPTIVYFSHFVEILKSTGIYDRRLPFSSPFHQASYFSLSFSIFSERDPGRTSIFCFWSLFFFLGHLACYSLAPISLLQLLFSSSENTGWPSGRPWAGRPQHIWILCFLWVQKLIWFPSNSSCLRSWSIFSSILISSVLLVQFYTVFSKCLDLWKAHL